MYIVQVNYFDKKGEQQEKELKSKTKEGIFKELDKFTDKYDIYAIPYVSDNLEDNSEILKYY